MMAKTNQDVISEQLIRNGNGVLALVSAEERK